MKTEIKDGNLVITILVITIPMQTPTPSASGNTKTEVMVNGKPVTVGLNAYISAN